MFRTPVARNIQPTAATADEPNKKPTTITVNNRKLAKLQRDTQIARADISVCSKRRLPLTPAVSPPSRRPEAYKAMWAQDVAVALHQHSIVCMCSKLCMCCCVYSLNVYCMCAGVVFCASSRYFVYVSGSATPSSPMISPVCELVLVRNEKFDESKRCHKVCSLTPYAVFFG